MDSNSEGEDLVIGGKTSPATGSVPRACDNCRARKIRCDKGQPCSSCKASKSVCRTTPIQKTQKQRVLISSQYEKKIDRIEDRLAGIERSLRLMACGKSDISDTPDTQSSISVPDPAHGGSPNDVYHAALPSSLAEGGCAVYENETTLKEHSVYAAEVLERAVDKTVLAGQNPEMSTALASLRNIVNRLGHQVNAQEALSTSSSGVSDQSLASIRLPWHQDVLDVLHRAKIHPSVTFTKFLPFMQFSDFEEICHDVYRRQGKVSQGRLVIFFGVCYHLAEEYTNIQTGHAGLRTFHKLANECRRNLSIAVANLNLLIPPSMENVQALLIGGAHGVEVSKPSVCRAFNSIAANLCQSLGFHRVESMKDDSEDEKYRKQSAFWFVYVMDKNLSLRIGRASSIQDYDISIPRPELGPKWQMMAHWVKVAEVQGAIYEHLYSPGAFRKSDMERIERAKWLLSRLDETYSSSVNFQERGPVPDFLQLIRLSDSVDYYTLMCLIHRATPQTPTMSTTGSPQPFNAVSPETIDAARRALQAHLECASRYKGKNDELWASYIHWAILKAPFTPFMLLFCRIITTLDVSDLMLLADFTQSLHSPPGGNPRLNSEGAEKMYKLCQVFHQVAKLYVEAKAREAEFQNAQEQRRQQQRHQQQQQRPLQHVSGPPDLSSHVDLQTSPAADMRLPADPTAAVYQLPTEEFNPYFNALGFMTGLEYSDPTAVVAAGAGAGGIPVTDGAVPHHMWTAADNGLDYSLNSTAGIQDWFSGNQNLMGLLEQDLDFGVWQ